MTDAEHRDRRCRIASIGSQRAGDHATAIRELQRWVAANGRDAGALLWLARLLNEVGRSEEAIPLYRRALAIESVNGLR